MKPEMIRKARMARLECICLGMALAQNGDRETILDALCGDDFESGIIGDSVEAIRTQDPESIRLMRKQLVNWGLDVTQGKVVTALLRKIKQESASQKFLYALDQVKDSVDHDDFLERAEEAMVLAKELVQ